MNSSDESIDPIATRQEEAVEDLEGSSSGNSMEEFYKLSQELLLITLVLIGIIFISVWIFYSLNIALNYLLGACAGIVYLNMLAKDVEQLNQERVRLKKNRFALLIGLIVIASQWHQLQVLPIFLGFLTYKATLIVYMLRITFNPDH
ncbi:ATP synthase subunit I [Mastigocoleus testarum]|uniref:ATP synthase subunit I n=1 Tax=Mastigocoleus testarum BC008 TaxID=371196 RepID=A0A0V7ZP61_9CYAN|nr:ATP synthase subunit I [Mastigocoleus testarum]KST65967.1 ATP synthase subunit I [Mastigocoleus testarum BC008]